MVVELSYSHEVGNPEVFTLFSRTGFEGPARCFRSICRQLRSNRRGGLKNAVRFSLDPESEALDSITVLNRGTVLNRAADSGRKMKE
jgi:hypothetical protein